MTYSPQLQDKDGYAFRVLQALAWGDPMCNVDERTYLELEQAGYARRCEKTSYGTRFGWESTPEGLKFSGLAEVVEEMRAWIGEYCWADLTPDDIAALTVEEIRDGIDRFFAGGVETFLTVIS